MEQMSVQLEREHSDICSKCLQKKPLVCENLHCAQCCDCRRMVRKSGHLFFKPKPSQMISTFKGKGN